MKFGFGLVMGMAIGCFAATMAYLTYMPVWKSHG